jgi:hypothetical protein
LLFRFPKFNRLSYEKDLTMVTKTLDCPYGPHLRQGTHYNYTAAGHTLIKSTCRPSIAETEAIRCGEATFGLYEKDFVLFFLCKFGKQPWNAGHYNWWLNPPMKRPDPLSEMHATQPSIEIAVELLDASNGVSLAGNTFKISAEPANMLRRSVLGQIETVLDPWDHLKIAHDVLRLSSDLSWMARDAKWIEYCRSQDHDIRAKMHAEKQTAFA